MQPDPDDLLASLARARRVLAFAEAAGDESAIRLAGMVVSGLLAQAEEYGIATGPGGLRAIRPGPHPTGRGPA